MAIAQHAAWMYVSDPVEGGVSDRMVHLSMLNTLQYKSYAGECGPSSAMKHRNVFE